MNLTPIKCHAVFFKSLVPVFLFPILLNNSSCTTTTPANPEPEGEASLGTLPITDKDTEPNELSTQNLPDPAPTTEVSKPSHSTPLSNSDLTEFEDEMDAAMAKNAFSKKKSKGAKSKGRKKGNLRKPQALNLKILPTNSMQPKTYRVKIPSLNVRKRASTSSAIVGVLHSGDSLTSTRWSNGWIEIGKDRWVHTKFLNEENP